MVSSITTTLPASSFMGFCDMDFCEMAPNLIYMYVPTCLPTVSVARTRNDAFLEALVDKFKHTTHTTISRVVSADGRNRRVREAHTHTHTQPDMDGMDGSQTPWYRKLASTSSCRPKRATLQIAALLPLMLTPLQIIKPHDYPTISKGH